MSREQELLSLFSDFRAVLEPRVPDALLDLHMTPGGLHSLRIWRHSCCPGLVLGKNYKPADNTAYTDYHGVPLFYREGADLDVLLGDARAFLRTFQQLHPAASPVFVQANAPVASPKPAPVEPPKAVTAAQATAPVTAPTPPAVPAATVTAPVTAPTPPAVQAALPRLNKLPNLRRPTP